MWLLAEYVPYQLFYWIPANQSAAVGFVDQLLATVRSLHADGVFHFDAHFGNVVTDGTRPLLTDFGLATSLGFDLSAEERAFIDAHRHYDFGVILFSAGRAVHDLSPADIDPGYAAMLERFGPVIGCMTEFLAALHANPHRDTFFDDARLASLLRDAGVALD